MLAAQRQQRILATLETAGEVRASSLSTTLGVSLDTVRRDHEELAQAGALRRVHGGAVPPAPAPPPARFAERLHRDAEAKAAIAQAALPLLRDARVILIGGGTTAFALARRLPEDATGVIVTTSPDVGAELCERPRLEVILVGGRVLPATRTVVGPEAVEAIRAVRADACVLGACGVHPDAGLTQLDREEAQIEREMARRAGRVIALADATKLGTAGPFVVADPGRLTHLVTERSVPLAELAAWRDRRVEVVRA
jgi:DeoR/GlpR family transcriptional regulator of sugar metabolism